MERYYPLLKRYDTIVVLYLPKASRKEGKCTIIEPSNISVKGVSVSGNSDALIVLKNLTRYQWFPDFVTSNGIIIESKGQMDASFPRLVRAFKEQHPILFRNYKLAFENPNCYAPGLRKRITYGEWADSIGVSWCHLRPLGRRHPPVLPEEWLHEKYIDSARNMTEAAQFDFDLIGDYEYEEI